MHEQANLRYAGLDRETILKILKIADGLKEGYPTLPREYRVMGRLFYGASRMEAGIADLVAARLGTQLANLDWEDVASKDTATLLREAALVSDSVDILLAAYFQSESFGEGHDIMGRLSEVLRAPFVTVADDLYHWQSALAHIHGFCDKIGGLSGKRIAVSWGFDQSFISPGSAHALLLMATHLGANVRIVAPAGFSMLGRVRTEARGIAKANGADVENTTDFEGAFDDVDAVFAANWLRLDDFSHPERFPEAARAHKDWCFDINTIPRDCLFSQEPPLDSSLMISPELAKSENDITSTYISRRVRTLAASILHATSLSLTELLS